MPRDPFADIGGRDHLVLSKALIYAVALIDQLPENMRPYSDQADMKRMLDRLGTCDLMLSIYQEQAGRALSALSPTMDA